MRLRSVHRSVSVERVQAWTTFPPVPPARVPENGLPTTGTLRPIRVVIDPGRTLPGHEAS